MASFIHQSISWMKSVLVMLRIGENQYHGCILQHVSGASEMLVPVVIRDDTMELPLIFFSAFEKLALESDDKMHRMGNIIQSYEPGPLPVLEPIMLGGFLSHVL